MGKKKTVETPKNTPSINRSKFMLKNKNLPLRQRMKNQLKAARFRYINEQFYCSSSSEAKDHFHENPDEFQAYHTGYKYQISQWPINPVDVIIKQIQRKSQKESKKLVVADFGCGDAKIARILTDLMVFSFDLVAINEHVKACDMSQTPLKNNQVDVVVFCLSLMGTNLSAYIKEANRVLKESGVMKIADVESRFENVDQFIKDIEKFEFELISKDLSHNIFYFLNFKKVSIISKSKKKKLPELTLKPCLYKKR